MIRSELSITIDAPPERVFARISDPMTKPEDAPAIVEVKDICGEGVGATFKLVYKMLGKPFEIEVKYTEYVPNQRIALEFKGGIGGNALYTLEPIDGGTKFTYTVDYNVPIPLVGKVAEVFLKKQNEREGKLSLENVKARVEAGQ